MTVVFDFDYTLFDTARFKEALVAAGAHGSDGVVAQCAEFVRPGAAALLEKLHAEGWSVMLMTLGEPEWQKRKVDASGLAPYFVQTFFAPETKEAMAHLLEGLEGPVTMVNDNGAEIDLLQERFPSFRMIAVRGPKPLPNDVSIPVCDSIEDIYKAVARR